MMVKKEKSVMQKNYDVAFAMAELVKSSPFISKQKKDNMINNIEQTMNENIKRVVE